jgi:predicted nucleic acid-binding protein
MSTAVSTIAQKIGGLGRRALIDTSVAVCLKETEFTRLLPDLATSTLTIAELVRGLHVQAEDLERRRRERHLQRIEAHIELLTHMGQ